MDPMDRIELKVDKVLDILMVHTEALAKHGVLHEKNAKELETHIARTNALEEHMDLEHKEMKKNLEIALLPIKATKWLGGLIAGLVPILAVLKYLGKI
jgi:hypothetical protein